MAAGFAHVKGCVQRKVGLSAPDHQMTFSVDTAPNLEPFHAFPLTKRRLWSGGAGFWLANQWKFDSTRKTFLCIISEERSPVIFDFIESYCIYKPRIKRIRIHGITCLFYFIFYFNLFLIFSFIFYAFISISSTKNK